MFEEAKSLEKMKTDVREEVKKVPPRPSISFKNCQKNIDNAIKDNAEGTFEDSLGLNLKQGKMTQLRYDELMAKILKVKSGDLQATAGIEHNIKVIASDAGGSSDMKVDVVVHYIVSNENESDKMFVYYAAANSLIQNASEEYWDKTVAFLTRIVTNTIKAFKFESDEQHQNILAQLIENGKTQLSSRL